MDKKIPFLIIEEDDGISQVLKKIILLNSPDSSINILHDGLDGLEYLKSHPYPHIVLLDSFLPQIGGMQIIKNCKNADELKDNYFILLAKESEKEFCIKAAMQGLDDFLIKPLALEIIIGKIQCALKSDKQNRLIKNLLQKNDELKQELDRKFLEIYNILTLLQTERIPECDEKIQRIKDMALWVGEYYHKNDAEFMTSLAYSCDLSFLNRLVLPDSSISLSLTSDGLLRTDRLLKLPVFIKDLIGSVSGFEKIFEILYSVYENYDGSGAPEKKQSRQIPFGARILRAVLDFESLFALKKYDSNKIFNILEISSKRIYDPKVLTLIDQYLAHMSLKNKYAAEQPVARKDLVEGMTLSRQIVTESGTKLMSAGIFLTQDMIDKIYLITDNDPVIGKIFVKNS